MSSDDEKLPITPPWEIAKPPPGWIRKAKQPPPHVIVKVEPLPEVESETMKRFDELRDLQLKGNRMDWMAWHSDPLVRAIASEVDDRELGEIAEAVMEVYEGYDRNIGESEASGRLTKDQAVEAAVLASQIVDWANYGMAYGDYGEPPWER